MDILNRRTGRFTYLVHDELEPASLGGDQVSAIYEDNQGTLWFATNAGISKYSRLKNRFRFIPAGPEAGSFAGPASCLGVDMSGALWISNGSRGVTHFDPVTRAVYYYPIDVGRPAGVGPQLE